MMEPVRGPCRYTWTHCAPLPIGRLSKALVGAEGMEHYSHAWLKDLMWLMHDGRSGGHGCGGKWHGGQTLPC